MKKILICLAAMLLVVGIACADQTSGGSTTIGNITGGSSTATATGNGGYIKDSGNSTVGNGIGNFSPSAKTEVDNKNISINKNSNKQAQGQLQGQLQGQVANGKVETNVTGDTNKVYANSWPSINGVEGVSSGTASTIFGSLGLSSTEAYKKLIPQIQAIAAIDPSIMNNDEKKVVIQELVLKMKEANRKQRLLGVGPEITGRSLINLFGILSWDSIWDENQRPLQSKSDIK